MQVAVPAARLKITSSASWPTPSPVYCLVFEVVFEVRALCCPSLWPMLHNTGMPFACCAQAGMACKADPVCDSKLHKLAMHRESKGYSATCKPYRKVSNFTSKRM